MPPQGRVAVGITVVHGREDVNEVGIVTVDEDGRQPDRYSSLVRPHPDAEHSYRTGAIHIHGISWDDVKDAPTWEQVAPQISARLEQATMLAQNSPFENHWLAWHMPQAAARFDPHIPTVDTLRVAQTHFGDLPNHRLGSVCEQFEVPYERGHRADNDAEAAARLYFRMLERIKDTYLADDRFARLPYPLEA